MKILAVGDFHGKFPENLKRVAKNVDAIISVGDFGGVKEWYRYLRYVFKQNAAKKPYKSAKEFFGKETYRLLDRKDEEVTKGILEELNSFGKPVIFVFGNTDDNWYDYRFDKRRWKLKKSRVAFVKKMKNLKEITYSKARLAGSRVVGFGGYMDIDAYVDEKARLKSSAEIIAARVFRRKKSKEKLDGLVSGGEEILVLHYPPKGYFDIIKMKGNALNGTSAGIGFFLEAIKKSKPALVLCGHMHEYQGMEKIGKSVLVNPGPAGEGKGAIIDFDEKVAKVKSVKFLR
jgi:Icc-related predicted phosphoesterase